MGISIQPPALTLMAYAIAARKSNRFANDPEALLSVRFGFFGEIGGLLASFKKSRRDHLLETEAKFASEELGDALWYLMAIADLGGASPSDVGKSCLAYLRRTFKEFDKQHSEETTFRTIDAFVATQGEDDKEHRNELLAELAADAGHMAEDDRSQIAIRTEPGLADRLGRLLGLLARSAASFGINLQDVARQNLEKIHDRWPSEDMPTYTSFFDNGPQYPEYERFEREFTVKFEERSSNDRPFVVQSINGVFVGDRLTDNSAKADGYRFHDVFHLAYVAHLGWSPVIRGLLKRKRKSNREVDENQDGARAMIIEEGIATWIFNHASARGFYEDVEVGKLQYGLLKQIRSMVEGYEVDTCPLWQWELAILGGFKVFRDLMREHGGYVVVDMSKHTVLFKPLRGPTDEC